MPMLLNSINGMERAARIAVIEGILAKEYTLKNVTKKEAEQLFKDFEPVKKSFITDFIEPNDVNKKPRTVNKYRNIVRNITLDVSFPKETVGKLRGFFNTKNACIISDIRNIFENSQYGYSSNYIDTKPKKDGSLHKEKSHVEAYHHFINKVAVDGELYYIRFVVEELLNTKEGQMHSAQVSKVEIIKEKAGETSARIQKNHLGETAQPAYDTNLAEFLNSVKKNV